VATPDRVSTSLGRSFAGKIPAARHSSLSINPAGILWISGVRAISLKLLVGLRSRNSRPTAAVRYGEVTRVGGGSAPKWFQQPPVRDGLAPGIGGFETHPLIYLCHWDSAAFSAKVRSQEAPKGTTILTRVAGRATRFSRGQWRLRGRRPGFESIGKVEGPFRSWRLTGARELLNRENYSSKGLSVCHDGRSVADHLLFADLDNFFAGDRVGGPLFARRHGRPRPDRPRSIGPPAWSNGLPLSSRRAPFHDPQASRIHGQITKQVCSSSISDPRGKGMEPREELGG